MKNSKLDCTIVLLSYNSLEVTDTCLAKIKVAIDDCEEKIGNKVYVAVVDNDSKDGSAEMIAKKYPWVQLIAKKENVGYARGNNLAMETVKTPFMLLMNSDTYINKDSLTKTFQKMVERPECDILVSRCFYANGVFQNYGGHLPTPRRIIRWSFGLESVPLIKSIIPHIYGYSESFYTKEGIMEWCPPCFFLLKTKVFTTVGGFDEEMFFHMVDAEWCHRIHKAGFVIGYTPTIDVIHLGGASSKNIQDKLLSDNFKGLAHFVKKHYSRDAHLVLSVVLFGLRLRSRFYLLTGKTTLGKTYAVIAKEVSDTVNNTV